MTSLPMSNCGPDRMLAAAAFSRHAELSIGNPTIEDEQSLLFAFRSFAEAAGTLQRSYGTLRAEVERLRRELQVSNAGLAQSLEENRSIRVHLDRILEGLPCGVVVVADNGQITRMNPEALRLLGIDSGRASGEAALISALPESVRHMLDAADTTMGEREIGTSDETGTMRWLSVRHACLPESGASESVFILRDVSERKRLEEAQAKLRREQALTEISTVLAHEIRNPLGSLELFAGLLAESDLDAESRKWVEHVQAGLRTLAATVNNVLHFHSLPEPERSPVDLGEMLTWARDFFQPLARQSRIALSLQNRLANVHLLADRHRLEQVLLNLVLNAVKVMPGGGWIELAGRKVHGGHAVALIVSDTGPGISPDHQAEIFEPGFSTRPGSPGLGLAVCRKIVEQHGGTITARNRPQSGAEFAIIFPLDGSLGGLTQ